MRADARSVTRLVVPPELLPAEGSTHELLVADADGHRPVHLAVADRHFAYPTTEFDVTVTLAEDIDGAVEVAVTAGTLVRDLLLQPDRLSPSATTGRGLATLLPGEQLRIRVTGCGDVSADDVRAALFCVEPA
ncbi:hypothetical protein AB0A71_33905 [Kitasatospora aureofaciens]|uniref:hypothetical protein n=1 Tax=Kitasatospora aureofaciens TaxID=1894 RepID=UPI0033EF63A1